MLPCAAWCTGQYGVKDMFVGVPCVLGANGVEKIIELKLTDDELAQLKKAGVHLPELPGEHFLRATPVEKPATPTVKNT